MIGDRVLAVDAGKTGTRAAVFAGGDRGDVALGPGVANVASAGGLDQVRAVLSKVLGDLSGVRTCSVACIGTTGVLEPSGHARAIGEMLVDLVQVARVVITSDVVTTHCGALGLAPGVVVAAGTGTIVLGVGPDGAVARIDGWGHLLDDGGSAFEIGREGLREALRAADGRGGSRHLHDAAMTAFGSTRQLVAGVYGSSNPARVVAGFAREVSAAADAGDPVAVELLGRAATRLGDSAVAAARHTFAADAVVPVSWQGGVFAAGAHVLDPFADRVRAALPAVDLRPPAGDALDGAALLARATSPTLVDGLLHVREVAAP